MGLGAVVISSILKNARLGFLIITKPYTLYIPPDINRVCLIKFYFQFYHTKIPECWFFFCCRMFLDSVMPSRANAMNCLVQCFPQCFAVQRADWKLLTFWWQILLTFACQHRKSPVAKSVVWNPFTTDSCRKLGISLKISPWNMEEAFSSKNSSLAIILSLCLSVCFFVSCSVSCKTYGSPGHKQTWLLCNAGVNFIKGVRGLYTVLIPEE